MAKTASPADKLASIPPRKTGIKSWFTKIDDAQVRSELEEIRRRWRANGYQHSKLEIQEFCCREFKLQIGYQVFVKWLQEKPNG